MKKFIAGLLLGLSLSAIPVAAEWGWGDMDLLKRLVTNTERIAKALERIAATSDGVKPPVEAVKQR